MKIILASKSKRRQELLKMMNIKYDVVVSKKDEIKDSALTPLENGINISLEKALEVKRKTIGDRIIIACDTFVIKGIEIYGKPKDRNDAYNILRSLSGTTHEVLSCLTVIKIKDNIEDIYQKQSSCKVTIDYMEDNEIYDWIDNHKPYDKAGAYAIQEEFGKYISKIEGDYYSIVGLPINDLYKILKEIE